MQHIKNVTARKKFTNRAPEASTNTHFARQPAESSMQTERNKNRTAHRSASTCSPSASIYIMSVRAGALNPQTDRGLIWFNLFILSVEKACEESAVTLPHCNSLPVIVIVRSTRYRSSTGPPFYTIYIVSCMPEIKNGSPYLGGWHTQRQNAKDIPP